MPAITILTHDARWRGQAARIRRAAQAALDAQSLTDVTLTILLSDDSEIQQLNRDYRQKNAPTNVLAFPSGEPVGPGSELGDIIMAYDTIRRESESQGKPMGDHITHLTIHGVLHLLGHDHLANKEAEVMEAKEIHILAAMGIANPYETD